MILRMMFSRKWILATLLVVVGAGVCIRLGIWQLDRLDQRRGFNAHYLEMIALPPLSITADSVDDLTTMEYRHVTFTGEYDFTNQIAIRNQYNADTYGYHLITPLLLKDGGPAILVDRGWVPPDNDPAQWRAYDESGTITATGILRSSRVEADFGGLTDPALPPGETRAIWNQPNISEIAKQLPYPVMPAYVQLDLDPARAQLPYRYQPEVEITEGPHMGYALQWFTFAIILAGGYPFFLRKQASLETAK
jgi:surfeit locus 1 family protein